MKEEETFLIEVTKPTKIVLNVNVCRLLMVRGTSDSMRKCLPLVDGAEYK